MHSLTVGSASPWLGLWLFPALECIIRIDILGLHQNPHIGSLTHRVWAVMLGGAKWKPLEFLIPTKIVNQKHCYIL